MSVTDEKHHLLVSTSSIGSDADSEDSSSFMSVTENEALLEKESRVLLVDEECQQALPPTSKRPSSLVAWIIVNVIATVLIVSYTYHFTTVN